MKDVVGFENLYQVSEEGQITGRKRMDKRMEGDAKKVVEETTFSTLDREDLGDELSNAIKSMLLHFVEEHERTEGAE